MNKTLINDVGLVKLFGHCYFECDSCSSLKNANGGIQLVLQEKFSKERATDVQVLQDSILGSTLFCYTLTQPAIACSKLTIETLQQGVKYVQS